MIRDPDRIIARLVSRLCPAGQRFICFHRILDASQFVCKALGKEETIFERHTYLPLSQPTIEPYREQAPFENGLRTALAESSDLRDMQSVPLNAEAIYAILS